MEVDFFDGGGLQSTEKVCRNGGGLQSTEKVITEMTEKNAINIVRFVLILLVLALVGFFVYALNNPRVN